MRSVREKLPELSSPPTHNAHTDSTQPRPSRTQAPTHTHRVMTGSSAFTLCQIAIDALHNISLYLERQQSSTEHLWLQESSSPQPDECQLGPIVSRTFVLTNGLDPVSKLMKLLRQRSRNTLNHSRQMAPSLSLLLFSHARRFSGNPTLNSTAGVACKTQFCSISFLPIKAT